MAKKKIKIPEHPEQLLLDALPIYESIYKILIEEDRGKAKYKHSVAICANSLHFYKKAIDTIGASTFLDPKDAGEAIRAMNSASNEYNKVAKTLLLTPEAEMKMGESEIEDNGISFTEALNKAAKDRSYGHKTEVVKSSYEKRATTNKEKNG